MKKSIFGKERGKYRDRLIDDLSDRAFQAAMKQYCIELRLRIKDWDALFDELIREGDNRAYVRTDEEGNVIGFVLFKPDTFTSWFFEETCGFIREFWVAKEHRGRGHGAELLLLTEAFFVKEGIRTSVLSTKDAGGYYEKHGYKKAPACRAKNDFDVYVKRL